MGIWGGGGSGKASSIFSPSSTKEEEINGIWDKTVS